jgi:hypothetical protein
MLETPAQAALLTRERISPWYFFSYTFIPLSSIAFPHIGIFCLTARKLSHRRAAGVTFCETATEWSSCSHARATSASCR